MAAGTAIPPAQPRWHRLVLGPVAAEPAELRRALLDTLDEAWSLQVFELLWTLAVIGLAWQATGQPLPPPWLAAWLGVELLSLPLRRAGLGRPRGGRLRALRVGANALRLLVTGLGAMAVLWLGQVALTVLGCVLVVGALAVVVARWAALPRLAGALVVALVGALAAGVWGSPLPGMHAVVAMAPVGALAFTLLAVHNHRLLLQLLRLQFENRRLSLRDPLTGLPNRREFGAQLSRAGGGEGPAAGRFALLCLDIDGFKHVNDDLGHDAGDQLLTQAAQRFRDALRSADAVSRIGGDEFAVLLPGAGRDTAGLVAQRLMAALARPFTLGGGAVARVGLSIGIAVGPDDGSDPQQLLRLADEALYCAKRDGKGCYRWAGGADASEAAAAAAAVAASAATSAAAASAAATLAAGAP